jgi:hypothetical protein
MVMVKLRPEKFKHEELGEADLDNNLFYQHNIQLLDRIEDNGSILIDTAEAAGLSELILKESVEITVNFVAEHQKETLCEIFYFDGTALGFFPTSSGDGFLSDDAYMNSFEVFVFCPSDEEYYNLVRRHSEDHYVFIEDAMEQFLSTLTHEICHALVFIESSGGLSPKEIDVAYEAEEYPYSVGDCASGCRLSRLQEAFSHGHMRQQHDIEINEAIVEEKGLAMFKMLGFDMDVFITEIEDRVGKSFYEQE